MPNWQAALGRRSLLRRSLTERDPAQGRMGALGEEGATLVEMAICSSILFSMLFGVIGMSMALYADNFVNVAARQATRWAMVRGSQSCSNTPNLTDCNATASEIQAYVQGKGYPGITSANLNVTTLWCAASTTTPGTWAACSASTPNTPGNEVQVQVTYVVPLGVPFLSVKTMSVGSISEMVISQ